MILVKYPTFPFKSDYTELCLQINGSTAAEDTLQTFQEVQLEAAEDENEENDEAAVVSPSATLDVPEANLDNGGSERGERVKGEISMLSSPLQVRVIRKY